MLVPTIPSLVKCVYYLALMQPFFALFFAITSYMPSIVETYMLLFYVPQITSKRS
jgi:hypothetical protein